MDLIDKPLSHDIDLGSLLANLDASPESPLVFAYEGRNVKRGYHVTEVKSGRFDALDCGANPETWTEIFVQLLDVEAREGAYMEAGKFVTIVRKVSEHVGLPMNARLTFEVSDGVLPMALYCASMPVVADGTVRVELAARAASCKPRDRWLHQQARLASCCARLGR